MTIGPLEWAVCLEVLAVPSAGMQGGLGGQKGKDLHSERLPEERGEDLQECPEREPCERGVSLN